MSEPLDLSRLSPDERSEVERLLKVLDDAATFRKFMLYRPYPKQKDFHERGDTLARLFMAGNRLGKSEAGAYETAYHLTGEYPDWWAGRRFDKPVKCWVAGETGRAVRDICQTKLMGLPGVLSLQGTGAIPRDAILDVSTSRGVTDAMDTVQVRHSSGGVSMMTFMSYDMGRLRWQGAELDFVWFDEEPPPDIYTEGMTRVHDRNGMVFMTFTPLKGKAGVVSRFVDETSPDRVVIQMTIDDVTHFTEEKKAQMIAEWPEHERDARARGIPVFGGGRVFLIPEGEIIIDPIPIPAHYYIISGMDFGIAHPTCAVWLAHDRDNDIVYVVGEYSQKGANAATNAAAIVSRTQFKYAPMAWPHDGHHRDKGGGEPLAQQYKALGVNMLSSHAVDATGSQSVEASVHDMLTRMQSGRWKVFRQCEKWLMEFRNYHRDEEKNGEIVKKDDDMLDASRYACMMLRAAKKAADCHGGAKRRTVNPVAKDVNYPMFGG